MIPFETTEPWAFYDRRPQQEEEQGENDQVSSDMGSVHGPKIK